MEESNLQKLSENAQMQVSEAIARIRAEYMLDKSTIRVAQELARLCLALEVADRALERAPCHCENLLDDNCYKCEARAEIARVLGAEK